MQIQWKRGLDRLFLAGSVLWVLFVTVYQPLSIADRRIKDAVEYSIHGAGVQDFPNSHKAASEELFEHAKISYVYKEFLNEDGAIFWVPGIIFLPPALCYLAAYLLFIFSRWLKRGFVG